MITKKNIVIGSIIFIISFIGISIYLLIPKSYIIFKTAPETVTVLIDDKDQRTITNGDTIMINPGKHTIKVFRDEFNPFITTVTTENGKTIEIVAALFALTDQARALLDNSNSSYVIEKATAINMDNQVDTLTKKYPILDKLPIKNRNYVVVSCPSAIYPDNPNKIALCVDIPSDDFKQIVKDNIRSLGFNPDEYEYIWNNYLSEV